MDRTATRGCSPLRQARARWVTRPARRRTIATVSMNAREAPLQGRRQLRNDNGLSPLTRKAHLYTRAEPRHGGYALHEQIGELHFTPARPTRRGRHADNDRPRSRGSLASRSAIGGRGANADERSMDTY